MSYLRPRTVADLLAARSQCPDWMIVAGGTDVMVPVNFGRRRPVGLIDVTAVAEISRVRRDGNELLIGSGVTFGVIERELVTFCPALASAARTVGSPQIRATATIGGNLGTASPAGDAHPVLVAYRATIEVGSLRGVRQVPIDNFFLSPGRNVLQADEVVLAVRIPVATDGTDQFAKVGVRNAMVISVASLAIAIGWGQRVVGVGLGSVGPTPLRARAAETFLAEQLWPSPEAPPSEPSEAQLAEFAALVAQAASPIDDLRGTARYRRQVVTVLAQRCATRAINERMTS